tara:strand:+ start:180 stop:434 length:255 start_codon:yes stop_codon:yes gene_type:complete
MVEDTHLTQQSQAVLVVEVAAVYKAPLMVVMVTPLLFLLLKETTEDQVQAVDVQVLAVAELLQQVRALLLAVQALLVEQEQQVQ